MPHFYKMTQEQLTRLDNYSQDLPTKHGMPIIEFLRTLERVEEEVPKGAPKKADEPKKKVKSVANVKGEDKKTTAK